MQYMRSPFSHPHSKSCSCAMWLCWSWSLVMRHMNSTCSRVPIMCANLHQAFALTLTTVQDSLQTHQSAKHAVQTPFQQIITSVPEVAVIMALWRDTGPLIVGDDHKLEVGLGGALGHDLAQGVGQRCRVGLIQVGGRFIQREDAAVEAEGLRQRQPDDQACQHLHHIAPFTNAAAFDLPQEGGAALRKSRCNTPLPSQLKRQTGIPYTQPADTRLSPLQSITRSSQCQDVRSACKK